MDGRKEGWKEGRKEERKKLTKENKRKMKARHLSSDDHIIKISKQISITHSEY